MNNYHCFLDCDAEQVTDYKNKEIQKIVEWGELSEEMMPDYIPDPFYWTTSKVFPLTDILSFFRSSGFFFNEKVKNIILENQLILPPYRIFPAQMKHKGKFYTYYYLHIKFDVKDFIDFPNTKLGVRANHVTSLENKFLDIELPKVNSLSEYRLLVSEKEKIYPFGIGIQNLSLCLDKPYDFLKVRTNFFVSSKLLYLLQAHEITGYQVKPNILFNYNIITT